MTSAECWSKHPRRGIVTTHPGGYPKGSNDGHFAASCCGDPTCVRELAGEAYKVTGILGVYRPDPQRSLDPYRDDKEQRLAVPQDKGSNDE